MRSPFVTRLCIFIVLFLALSGYFGSWIVGTKLLYPFGFFIYGNVGKVLLFSLLPFALLTGKKVLSIPIPTFEQKNIFILIPAILLIFVFPFVATHLLAYRDFFDNMPLSLLAHLFVITIPLLLALGIFGLTFWREFFKIFYRQLLLCGAIGIGIYFAIFSIWGLWPYLSDIVLKAVLWLFSFSDKTIVYFPPRTLFVEKFAVTIDQACSGLESFLLFTVLSLFIAYVDRKKIDFKKFIVFYIVGMIGTFLVNILRVYGIIWSGLIFSPRLAATLFHTYLGMVLFIIYFVLLTKFIYYRLLISSKK